MKLSSQEEYGLRCLLRVGREWPEGSVTIPELARSEGISEPNVAKMLRVLRRRGFVRSTRGASGGYTLTRAADQIRVGEVLAALGGRLYEPGFCEQHVGAGRVSTGGDRRCAHMPDCTIRSVWRTLQSAIDSVLSTLTVKDLLRGEEEMNVWASMQGQRLPTHSKHF